MTETQINLKAELIANAYDIEQLFNLSDFFEGDEPSEYYRIIRAALWLKHPVAFR